MDQLKPRRRRAGLAGFTLLEVMIALGVLAFGLLAMLALQMQAFRGGSAGRHSTFAAQVARDQMEILQRQPWAASAPTGGFVAVAPRTLNVATGGNAPVAEQAFNVAFRITTVLPNLRELEVNVTWAEPNDPLGWPARRTALTSRRYGP